MITGNTGQHLGMQCNTGQYGEMQGGVLKHRGIPESIWGYSVIWGNIVNTATYLGMLGNFRQYQGVLRNIGECGNAGKHWGYVEM